jgi:phosphotransferase system  glucose/maltose/N-acetylglucosamine-specific IIC component
MNVADVFDWAFMWSMFRNFVATASPFVMIIVAISAAGLLLGIIIGAVSRRKV